MTDIHNFIISRLCGSMELIVPRWRSNIYLFFDKVIILITN